MTTKPNHCTAETCQGCMYVKECQAATKLKTENCLRCNFPITSNSVLCADCSGKSFGENIFGQKVRIQNG